MSISRVRTGVIGFVTFVWFASWGGSLLAQGPSASTAQESQHQRDANTPGGGMAMAREGSGTSWLPDDTAMYAVHGQNGRWQLMFHENAFVQFLHDSGNRGADQVGSINWAMGMAQRNVGRARVMFRGMFSAEPATIGGCGYPDLLASGEL